MALAVAVDVALRQPRLAHLLRQHGVQRDALLRRLVVQRRVVLAQSWGRRDFLSVWLDWRCSLALLLGLLLCFLLAAHLFFQCLLFPLHPLHLGLALGNLDFQFALLFLLALCFLGSSQKFRLAGLAVLLQSVLRRVRGVELRAQLALAAVAAYLGGLLQVRLPFGYLLAGRLVAGVHQRLARRLRLRCLHRQPLQFRLLLGNLLLQLLDGLGLFLGLLLSLLALTLLLVPLAALALAAVLVQHAVRLRGEGRPRQHPLAVGTVHLRLVGGQDARVAELGQFRLPLLVDVLPVLEAEDGVARPREVEGRQYHVLRRHLAQVRVEVALVELVTAVQVVEVVHHSLALHELRKQCRLVVGHSYSFPSFFSRSYSRCVSSRISPISRSTFFWWPLVENTSS